MNLLRRLSRFGTIGILATLVHALVLTILVRIVTLPTDSANLIAFITAFLVSTSAQQAFTFNDRLAGQILRKRSLIILFAINCLISYLLGAVVNGDFIAFLALVPAIVNFTLLHFFSGHPGFKR